MALAPVGQVVDIVIALERSSICRSGTTCSVAVGGTGAGTIVRG